MKTDNFSTGNAQNLWLQHLALKNGQKEKFGFALPAPFVSAFYKSVAGRVGSKEKWLPMSAAILMFLEADEAAQDDAIRRVQTAGMVGGSYDDLVKRAVAGKPPRLSPTKTSYDPMAKGDFRDVSPAATPAKRDKRQ